MTVKPVPENVPRVTPYLMVRDAPKLLEFIKTVFAAAETCCVKQPDGLVMHAKLGIGAGRVMLAEARGEWKAMPAQVYVYVENADVTYQRALGAGGESVMEVTTMKHAGERYGGVKDPTGNIWWIVTRVEALSPEEMDRREQEFVKKQFGG